MWDVGEAPDASSALPASPATDRARVHRGGATGVQIRHLLLGPALATAKAADVTTAAQVRPLGRNPAYPPARLPAANGGAPSLNGKRPRRETTLPVHRSILAVDIEDSTRRTNTVKEELRHLVYQLVLEALGIAGIDDHYYDPFTDRGDGVLVLVRPADEFPKPLLISCLIPALARLLAAHNSGIPLTEQPRVLRLRAVIHAGEVHYDGKGFFGEDLDVAFRLLDAPRFKAQLRTATTPLALVASDYIYQSIIRHGYAGIDDGEFFPLVTVNVGDQRRKGWVHLPRTAGYPVVIPAQAEAC